MRKRERERERKREREKKRERERKRDKEREGTEIALDRNQEMVNSESSPTAEPLTVS